MTGQTRTSRPTPRGPRLWSVALAVSLSVGAVVRVELSIPALLLCLIAGLSLPPLPPRARRWAIGAVVGAAAVAVASLGRFAMGGAMTGIVEAGQRATGKSVIYRLREVVIAEDGLRKTAMIDPDGDGVGSADLIGALAGAHPLRGRHDATPPLLNYRFGKTVETPGGLAADVGSHLIQVCLPAAGGGWVTDPADAVDDEAAERRFVAYAWPSDVAPDVQDVVFIDEHERILTLEAERAPYRGVRAPPPCDAALRGAEGWAPWKNKQARSRLPGDSS